MSRCGHGRFREESKTVSKVNEQADINSTQRSYLQITAERMVMRGALFLLAEMHSDPSSFASVFFIVSSW